jgi:hypothetical protein
MRIMAARFIRYLERLLSQDRYKGLTNEVVLSPSTVVYGTPPDQAKEQQSNKQIG